jgi:hypothetical protein
MNPWNWIWWIRTVFGPFADLVAMISGESTRYSKFRIACNFRQSLFGTLVIVAPCFVPAIGLAQCPTQVYNVPTRVFAPIPPHPGTTRVLANPLVPSAASLLTVVALGDSVVWGNGLKNPNKFIMLAGQQIADATQRTVQIISFAHSAAKLALHSDPGGTPSPDNGYVPMRPEDNNVPQGDLNYSYPTTTEQADCAGVAYAGAEIVVLDGCINEVGATDIALPPIFNHTSKEQIEERVFQYCSTPMKDTLQKVKTLFPQATVIVMNYFRIVSPESNIFRAPINASGGAPQKNGSSTKELERLAEEQLKIEKMKGAQGRSLAVEKADVQRWPDNSTAFLENTERCFRWAIMAAPSDVLSNAGTAQDPACPAPSSPLPTPSPFAVSNGLRVYLATVLDRPEFSYGGKKKNLWSLPIQFLFWTIHADDMYRTRKGICKTHYGPGAERRVCEINPIAHPNEEGAKAYACSIVLNGKLKCDPNQAGILDLAWSIR